MITLNQFTFPEGSFPVNFIVSTQPYNPKQHSFVS